MVIRYRYSEWDGAQEIPPLDPDDVLNALTDDLMNFGDLQHALRNLLQRGMRNNTGDRTQGLRDMLQQLRQQRRQQLDRYNLSSAFEDIQKRLEQILEKERSTLDDRLGGQQQDGESGEGSEQGEASEGESDDADGGMEQFGYDREGQQAQQPSGGQRSQQGQRGQQGQ